MSPSAETLHRRLQSESANLRLQAARYLADHAGPQDEQALREALARERVQWIRSALRRAIARVSADATGEPFEQSIDRDDLPAGFAAQVHAEALETTASQLMHEIEPLLGSRTFGSNLCSSPLKFSLATPPEIPILSVKV